MARKPRAVSTKLDPFCEYLLGRMLSADPVSNAEVLYEEIREQGYQGGKSVLREFLHPFRQLARERATVRFETPPVASELLGHATVGITLDLYSHVSESMQREAARAMDEILKPA